MDDAIPQADFFETYGLTVTAAGSETSGQSSSTITYSTRAATANQWRVLRTAEDPDNEDITAAYCSVVVVQNLNQVNSGGLTSAS
jgi:ethanolamine utilization protein EutA (predicted chaperonin)